MNDCADGSGGCKYEDKDRTLFKLLDHEDEYGRNMSGIFYNGRI